MSFLRAIVMAFACFSTIPMPIIDWDDEGMGLMMAAFPLVGVVIGGCVLAWGALCGRLGFSPLTFGAGLTLIPIAISGAIHMDGLADVIDAQSSHAAPERKREILKDPHTGAFAIIGVCCYLIAYLALASEVDPQRVVPVASIPVVSRCLSGLATVTLSSSRKEGMYATESGSARSTTVRTILVLMLVPAAAVMLRMAGPAGAVALAAALATLAGVAHMAKRDFGGMSGDLAGYFLQMAELAMLACLVVVGRMVA